jgi:threonylcarbamoyladenosine tRNA methylthiotransferase CDKAL1
MRIFVKSYGCSTNLSDGEVLAGCLSEAGFDLVQSILDADVIVYNSCAVKGPTEDRMISLLKRAPNGKKVVVAGCLPLTSFDRLQRDVRFDAAIGPAAGLEIVDVVKRVLAGERIISLDGALYAKPVLSLPKFTQNPVVSLVPVGYGCLGSCSYCCVVFARGCLRSYPIEEIKEKIKSDLTTSTKEFWLTSQDMACYGKDLGTNLAMLLKSVCAVSGDFRVRVGMMTPNFALDILDELVEAFRSEKVFEFLHLPVQSGDDAVLKRMRRFYTVQDFKKVVAVFREAFPELTLATDVICGFPGENKKAFENTLRLISEVKPDIVNISKFFGRPGTTAAKMSDAVKQTEIKRRSAEAAKLAKQISLERNKRWEEWTGGILIDEKGKMPGSWIGRNLAYKPVTVKKTSHLLGKTLQVRVVKGFPTYLEGTIIE